MANRFVFMLRREALRLDERQQASRRGFEAWILTSRKILHKAKTATIARSSAFISDEFPSVNTASRSLQYKFVVWRSIF
ncbi:hypothetical protein TNCV_610281 [Trichonephila clavipes]|nr:hypothetical protein TNCV_610281 [Trichonephila clavipes]